MRPFLITGLTSQKLFCYISGVHVSYNGFHERERPPKKGMLSVEKVYSVDGDRIERSMVIELKD